MLTKIYFVFRYLKYLITARFYYGHGVHSPFLYKFVRSVLFTHDRNKFYKKINRIVKAYYKNKDTLFVDDFGAGSIFSTGNSRTVSEIARFSATKTKYGKVLFRMMKYFKVQTALELGTSLGVGSLYMAISGKVHLHTIEGDKSQYQIAKATFEKLGLNNITAYNGTFEEVLPSVLEKIDRLDFVFFDGNHTQNATLSYFEQCLNKIHNETVFVFDDIHWSEDMEEAWEEIKKHPKVKVSLDLFQMGIVFFRKELSKEHYIIRY